MYREILSKLSSHTGVSCDFHGMGRYSLRRLGDDGGKVVTFRILIVKKVMWMTFWDKDKTPIRFWELKSDISIDEVDKYVAGIVDWLLDKSLIEDDDAEERAAHFRDYLSSVKNYDKGQISKEEYTRAKSVYNEKLGLGIRL